jgi:hypothetical protein
MDCIFIHGDVAGLKLAGQGGQPLLEFHSSDAPERANCVALLIVWAKMMSWDE